MVEGVELSIGERLVVQVIGVLYVDGVSHSVALCDRRLREVLTTTQLLQNARALILTLELLQGALDVLALLYRSDNHSCILFLCLMLLLFEVFSPLGQASSGLGNSLFASCSSLGIPACYSS